MSLINEIKKIADSCRNDAEYNRGTEAGYQFLGIAEQLDKLVEKPINQHVFDMAKQIENLPPGIYKSWRGKNSIGELIGLKPGRYYLLLEAFKILKKQGKIHKIKKNGERSDHGQLWVIGE